MAGATRQRKPRKAQQPPARYCNAVELAPDTWDLTLVCGRYRKVTAVGEWINDPQARVTISWSLAKQLLFELTGSVLAYERRFGTFGVPQHLIPALPSAEHFSAEAMNQLIALRNSLFFVKLSQEELDAATAEVAARIMPTHGAKGATH